MSTAFQLRLHTASGYVEEGDCLTLTLEREAYTPYAQLTAGFLAGETELGAVQRVELYWQGTCIFLGIADNVRKYRRGGVWLVQVQAKSYTSVLAQNEIAPGLHADLTMASLMTGFYQFPYVTYEEYAGSGYIYASEGTTMWDSIVSFCYKLSGRYPYIYGNMVRLTPHANPQVTAPAAAQVLEYGSMTDTTKLVRMYHMEDMQGNPDVYALENAAAAEAELVRHRQIAMDREFLYDPEAALRFRNAFSQRGCRGHYVEYAGFANEQICDRVTFGTELAEAVICRVRMQLDGRGLRTKLWAYEDGFYHRV